MRDKILDAAESLVQSRGLNAVTFQDLADAVGLRKPSLFHHVKNKEELTLALIERCSTKHGPKYEAIVEKDTLAPAKLREIAKLFEDGVKQERPCLLAALEGGMDSLSDTAVNALGKAAEGAIGRFERVFAQGRKEGSLEFSGDTKHAAMAFYAMLQGLQSLCRAKGEFRTFKKAASTYIDAIAVT